jgi:hypothetical protein
VIGFISTSVTFSLLITINTALSPIYTIDSSPLHAHEDSESSLVVSRQRISTQKLALQIIMRSSYFIFNHSVLICPNPYSIDLHNSLRTRSILVLVLSTAEPSWTLLSCKQTRVIQLPQGWTTQFYCRVAQTTQKTSHVIAISPVYWRTDCCLATSYKQSFYCRVRASRGVHRAFAWQCVDMSQYTESALEL